MMEIGIVVFDGCDELDVIGPYEVLDNAGRLGADLRVQLVSLGSRPEVTGDHGIRLRSHRPIGDDLDVIIVPGGGWNDRRDEYGLWGELQRGELPAMLRHLHQKGVTVASVCTGAMLLASSGLTRGRSATTHHANWDDLAELGAEVVDMAVVDDGDLITSRSTVAGVDMALWLVEREWGKSLAQDVEQEMEYQRREEVHLSLGEAFEQERPG